MVIWLIGLAGAGKSSIGGALTRRLKAHKPATVLLDGDRFREIMGNDVGHSLAEREINGWRMCRMCAFLDQQGIDVVCCILSLFPEQRAWNRKTFSRYFEVFIDVPMGVLEARDQKGLYSAARAGKVSNVAGIDLAFLPPEDPDLVIRNEEDRADFDSMAGGIFDAIKRKYEA